ncbi:DoxX-like family protein [Aliikangiella sp. IMCC44359]|uniref:DoxX-like family protein n=1 Tax=Aliikangiella sp. IMCC44359 TaxID=3459125 RepID=UPI00403ADE55
MSSTQQKYIRFSLAFVWIFTALTSAFFDKATGAKVLSQININGALSDALIYTASTLDFIIGVWIISNKKAQLCCQIQIVTIFLFTILLTVIAPQFWLHPFGPLTKNVPMLTLIVFYRNNLQTNSA